MCACDYIIGVGSGGGGGGDFPPPPQVFKLGGIPPNFCDLNIKSYVDCLMA